MGCDWNPGCECPAHRQGAGWAGPRLARQCHGRYPAARGRGADRASHRRELRARPHDCGTKYGFDSFNGEPAGPTPDDLWTEPASPTELYGNHGQYVSEFEKATKDAESAGFVLPADAKAYKQGAAHSDVGH